MNFCILIFDKVVAVKHSFFAYMTISVTLCLFVLVGTINYVIDPYGYNTTFHLALNAIKKTQNERSDKLKLLSAYPHATSFIFGSSRGLQLNPDSVTALTGDETLNMAFSGASADEYYLYIKYLIATRKVKNIIIAVDLFAYADGYESGDKMPDSLLAYHHLDKTHYISSYFTYDTLKDALKTIEVNRKNPHPLVQNYQTHGYSQDRNYANALKNTTTMAKYIQDNVINKPPYWNTRKDTLSSSRLAQLREIKQLCTQKNIHLYVFMSPLWIKQITVKQNKFFLQKRLLRYIVTHIQPVWDYNGITDINTDPYAYNDSFHFAYPTGDSMLTEIITGKPRIKKYSGTYVTQQNIEAYLHQTDQRYQQKVNQ